MKKEDVDGGTLETWTVAEVEEALREGRAVLIDVRTPQEYMFEHVEGALLFPLAFFRADSLPSQEGKRLVFHCGSGARSEKVARQCLAAGITPVAHLEGGFGAWKKEGRSHIATDMATGAPKRVG
ncbi:rhodanese-like domain-containing protein [Roseitranquillus sediminis]|uniref:rhodanese-like domain-containing protein n=1 Tax=Roseitranquillus sediminis TaxID=2809051 RepID=UPI001D0BFAC0|nr:rhodanese-like domain-containing protein [Roseitranquillus sediminis]MBM9593149.1 rhodanese-like domain-containing protein [Roseitranquillus sediminis]